jgi:flagellar biosynthesis/type III secretory pathway protein FliH
MLRGVRMFSPQLSIEEGRLKNMHNSLLDTPVYQEMMRMAREEAFEEGFKKGFKEGFEEGLKAALQEVQQGGFQQGQYLAYCDAIMFITLEKFPSLVALVKKRVTTIKNSTILRHILVRLSTAQSAQEIEAYLNQIPEDVL